MKPKDLIKGLLLGLILGCTVISCSDGTNRKGPKSDSGIAIIGRDSIANILDSSKILREADLAEIHVCTEMLPPPKKASLNLSYLSDTAIFFRNDYRNDTIIHNTLKRKQQHLQYIAEWFPYHWDHNTLTVMFLDGDAIVKKRVIEVAKQWEDYCGLKFNFGVFQKADITISFRYKGSWSYIGNYSVQNTPSMNFGWLTANTDQEEYNRVVLHEFGHAIGFIHEHQNPDGNPIPWNKIKVYQYYMGPPNNWNKSEVDENIFAKYDAAELNSTKFDEKSIMLYAIPALLTDSKFSTEPNVTLSDLDKELVGKIYPKNGLQK